MSEILRDIRSRPQVYTMILYEHGQVSLIHLPQLNLLKNSQGHQVILNNLISPTL